MIPYLTQLVLRGRYLLWAVVVLSTLALWWTTPEIQFDQSVESFFPDDHPALVSYRHSKRSFGGDHVVFVVYDDPDLWSSAGMKRVRDLANQISKKVPGVVRVDALDEMPVPWAIDAAAVKLGTQSVSRLVPEMGGSFSPIGKVLVRKAVDHQVKTLMVKRLVAGVETSATDRDTLRKRLCAHPLFRGLLVSADGKSTALVVRLKDPALTDHRLSVRGLRQVGDEFARQHKFEHVAVAGPPVLIADGFESLDLDNRRLGLVAMALMALTMLVAVRNPGWALLPLLAGWATWEVTKAFLVYFDLRLSLSSGPIVAQTIVLCMPAASHLASRFTEAMRAGLSRNEAEKQTLLAVFMPIAWCSMTAASGYFAMWAATTVAPVAQFGLVMFVCNLLAGGLAWCLGAGAMALAFRTRFSKGVQESQAAVSGHVGTMTTWVMSKPQLALCLFAVPILVATIGMTKLQFESNYINVYRPTARIARDYHFIEDRLGGIGLVELVFPAPETLTPEWLARLSETSAALKQTDPGLVSSVISLDNILNMPEDLKNVQPQRIVDIKYWLLSLSRYSQFLDDFWHQNRKTMRLLVRIRESESADRKEACFTKMQAEVSQRLSKRVTTTGLSHLMTKITEAVVVTSFLSGLWSAGISLVMLWVALRNLRLALLALTPTLMAVGLVMGVMGWIGLKIDMSTVFVASVAIGLSVDDAFHCLLRWKETIRDGRSPSMALREAYAGSGAGVVLSSAGVSLGFLAMLFSEFMPMFHFGWLISVATLGGSLGNLVVIPAILAWVTDARSAPSPQVPPTTSTSAITSAAPTV